ncbi:MAG: hypothetical protein ACKVOH_04350 [Chlamydiales bacterium]
MGKTFFFSLLLLLGAVRADGGEQHILFVIHAKAGFYAANGENSSQGLLILKDVDQSVAYFSNRPGRHAGKTSLSEFLENWPESKDDLKTGQSNAGFVFFQDIGDEYSDVPISLQALVYDPVAGILKVEVIVRSRGYLPSTPMEAINLYIATPRDE